jgi:aryl-alcohol dehydrogenase-like predicted oxidoreductase
MENRRNFIKKIAGLTAGLTLPVGWACTNSSTVSDKFGQLLPLRKLGSTGERVTMLGVGGYHIGWTTERDAQEVIEKAMEGGIRFFDTAHNYGKGASEERYGKYLVPKYRDQIFLMTKTQALDGDSLLKEVDLSLKRLKTDQVDLIQLHSFKDPADVDSRIENGVMDAIHSVLNAGKTRYIGFTGHRNPYAHLRMMEKLGDFPGFSTLQMPISAVDANSTHSFINEVAEPAIKKNLGLLAMKTLADGRFFGKKQNLKRVIWESEQPVIPTNISIREALYFSWSMPISVLITGAENTELLSEKIDLARDFVKLSVEEKDRILESASSAENPEKVEYYKRIET